MAIPPIPNPPSDTPKGIYDPLRAMKVAIDTLLGRTKGGTNDKAVTVGMLAGGVSPTPSTPTTPAGLLGLGNAAYKNVGTGPNTVAAGNHTHNQYDSAGAASDAVHNHENTGTHPWIAIIDKDDAYTVPEVIPAGAAFTINSGRQMNIHDGLDIDGGLDINGTLNLL